MPGLIPLPNSQSKAFAESNFHWLHPWECGILPRYGLGHLDRFGPNSPFEFVVPFAVTSFRFGGGDLTGHLMRRPGRYADDDQRHRN